MEKELVHIHDEAKDHTPAIPEDLYERVDNFYPSNGAPLFDPNPWSRLELDRMANGEHPELWEDHGIPSQEGQARARELIAVLDQHEAIEKRIWAAYDRFEKQFNRDCAKQWRLFEQIIRTKAETLQGVAAQLEVIDRNGRDDSDSDYYPKTKKQILKVMRNVPRLVAAQAAGA